MSNYEKLQQAMPEFDNPKDKASYVWSTLKELEDFLESGMGAAERQDEFEAFEEMLTLASRAKNEMKDILGSL